MLVGILILASIILLTVLTVEAVAVWNVWRRS